jgi:putative transcriptional regulator
MVDNNNYYIEETEVQESLEGRVLVANTSLDGSCFERSLIYVCAHDAQHAIGVIFNKQIGTITTDDLAKHVNISDYKAKNLVYPVMFGGPVESDQFMILTVTQEQYKNFNEKKSVTCHMDVDNFFKQVVTGKNKDKFLLIQGIASWDGQQLLDEIEENSWLIAEPTAELLFSKKIRNKWQYAVKNLGVQDFSKLVSYSGNA